MIPVYGLVADQKEVRITGSPETRRKEARQGRVARLKEKQAMESPRVTQAVVHKASEGIWRAGPECGL